MEKLSFAFKILELSSYKNYNNDNNNIDDNNDNDIQNNNDNNKIASPTRGMHWLTGIFPPVNRVFGQPVYFGCTAKTDLSPRRNKLTKVISSILQLGKGI